MTKREEIKKKTLLEPEQIVYLAKGCVYIRADEIKIEGEEEGKTLEDALLQLIKDGWTAIPF